MAGFEPIFRYLSQLEAHNDRTWFHEHHKEYEQVVKDYLNLLDLIRFSIGENAPQLAESILSMQPKDWMYRVARDARVNRNKPPYDPSLRAFICPDRRSWQPIGYFLELAPGGSCYGTGVWYTQGAASGQVRDYILAHWEELSQILAQIDLPLMGETLKRLPRGYEEYAQHLAAPLLKRKGWYFLASLEPEDFRDFDTFDQTIRTVTRKLEPFRLFMLEACSVKHQSADQRAARQLRDFYGSW